MKFKKIITYSIIILLFLFLQLQYNVIKMSNVYKPEKSDVILILGHSLENGEVPGEWSANRLRTGLDLYERGYAKYILVSGGKGSKDNFPVGQSMKEWLIREGVPEHAIILEDKASNTYENILFANEILQNLNFENVIIVTNDFHMYRSMLIASDFFTSVSGQKTDTKLSISKFLAYIKEPFSIAKYEIWNKILQNK